MRALPRRHFIEHRSRGVDIHAGIDVFPSELLRRHVGEGALGESHARHALGYIGGVGRQQFRQAEIKQLHSALGGQTEVSWFQIPVQDALVMGGLFWFTRPEVMP